MLTFYLTLPARSAPDVVTREMEIQIGSAAPVTLTLTPQDVKTPDMEGQQDDPVVGSLVDIDDAGNRSDAREFSYVLRDVIKPPKPGELGMVVTGESFPEPTPEPPPAPAPE